MTGPFEFQRTTLDLTLELIDQRARAELKEAPFEMATAGGMDYEV